MVIARARSILAETEEPTVLTQFFWNRNRHRTDLQRAPEPRENRNRFLEPLVPETHFLVTKCNFLLLLLSKFIVGIQGSIKLYPNLK